MYCCGWSMVKCPDCCARCAPNRAVAMRAAAALSRCRSSLPVSLPRVAMPSRARSSAAQGAASEHRAFTEVQCARPTPAPRAVLATRALHGVMVTLISTLRDTFPREGWRAPRQMRVRRLTKAARQDTTLAWTGAPPPPNRTPAQGFARNGVAFTLVVLIERHMHAWGVCGAAQRARRARTQKARTVRP